MAIDGSARHEPTLGKLRVVGGRRGRLVYLRPQHTRQPVATTRRLAKRAAASRRHAERVLEPHRHPGHRSRQALVEFARPATGLASASLSYAFADDAHDCRRPAPLCSRELSVETGVSRAIAFAIWRLPDRRLLWRRGDRAGPLRLAPCRTIGIARAGARTRRRSRGCLCPNAALRVVPARLLLLCLPSRSSWLTLKGGRQIGAARVLHRRGGGAAVAVSAAVAGGVPNQQRSEPPIGRVRRLLPVRQSRKQASHRMAPSAANRQSRASRCRA
jgi:hypothetical protein